MKTIIQINNHDAIPIRAIPYVTGWKIQPDKLLLILAHEEIPQMQINDLYAYNISVNDEYVKILPMEWDNVYAVNKKLSSELSRNQFNLDEGYPTWIVESIKLIPPACFVWKDDFEEKFNKAYSRLSLHIPSEREGDGELNFSPLVPTELESVLMEGFVKNLQPDKPLSSKERETLLIIIAALAKDSNVDISKISKAALIIADSTQRMGVAVGATTIENHLKMIPQALQNRAK